MQRAFSAAVPNHPIIIWGVCFLWLTALVTIVCALVLFYCAGDVVGILRMDMVLALSLLSGLIMSPTNVFMLYIISKGEGPNANVLCCPLWLSVASVIIINLIGACLCIYKIIFCWTTVKSSLLLGMQYYRSNARYKHFMDTIQWAVKCCGLDSYTDWFSRDWYDVIRDYDWEPTHSNKREHSKRSELVTDSVPLSCCKTGSCLSNYLTEMGTKSIHTSGCARQVYFLVMSVLIFQLMMFLSVIIAEVFILCYLAEKNNAKGRTIHVNPKKRDVKHIFNANACFESSGALESGSDDSPLDDSYSQKRVVGGEQVME